MIIVAIIYFINIDDNNDDTIKFCARYLNAYKIHGHHSHKRHVYDVNSFRLHIYIIFNDIANFRVIPEPIGNFWCLNYIIFRFYYNAPFFIVMKVKLHEIDILNCVVAILII